MPGCDRTLGNSQHGFAEFLAAFGPGHRGEEFLAAEALHLAKDVLERAPIGYGLLEPDIPLVAGPPFLSS